MMMRTHPHAHAAYRVVTTAGGAFAVEVTVPDTHPATVSSFPTEQAAEAWIARAKQRVAAEGQAGKWFRRPARDRFAKRPATGEANAQSDEAPAVRR